VVTGQGSTKSDKYRKPKLIPDTSDRKKTVGPIRKGKPSKLSPLDEARARAEKLRAFKSDLQKMKKEKVLFLDLLVSTQLHIESLNTFSKVGC